MSTRRPGGSRSLRQRIFHSSRRATTLARSRPVGRDLQPCICLVVAGIEGRSCLEPWLLALACALPSRGVVGSGREI
jgi:hypothetical protein